MNESGLVRVLLIGFAGSLGALSRYWVQLQVTELIGRPTIYGTLIVNISGAFALGLLFALTEDGSWLPMPWRTVLGVGFLGAFTTFSTLMLESFDRFDSGDPLAGLANIALSVLLGLLAVYGGIVLGRVL